MKTTAIKTIYLKEHELKQAIVEYLEKTDEELAQHLYDNSCSMEWGWKDWDDPAEVIQSFVVSVDGEVEKNE